MAGSLAWPRIPTARQNPEMRVYAIALLMVAVGLAAPEPAAAQGAAVSSTLPDVTGWLPVFDDEFDGTFNGQPIMDVRNIRGAATPDGLDDRVWLGTNYSEPEGISVADGYLTFRAYTENGRTFNPDWLVTGENEGLRRAPFGTTYGYIEARLNLAQPEGANEAFWMYSQDLHWWYGKPLRDPAAAGIEIDIEEEWGTDAVHHTLHWDGYADTHRSEGSGRVTCPGSTCQGNFHTYGVLWDPTGYRFYIDGQETYFQPRGASHHPGNLIIGAAIDRPGLDLGPKGDPRNALMLVDYVKVWQPAVSDIADRSMQRNVPVAVPFTVSSITSDDPNLPGPRVATVDAISSNQNVVRNADLVVSGTGADRTLGIMSRFGSGAGTTTITVRARNAAGTVLGTDTFTVTVTDPAAAVPTLGPGSLPDLALLTGRPAAVEFRTNAAEGSTPTVTARSSNQYLLPDAKLAFGGSGRTRALSLTPLPTRTGTSDVTVTATDPADGSVSSDTFRVTVTLDQLRNGGFESGLPPWTLIGGTPPVVSAAAAHSGTQGMHVDVAAVKQKIPVEPNTTYALGGWGRTNAAGGLFDIGVLDTNTYPDWDGNGQPDDPDGAQMMSVRFDSTDWAREEVVFTTGNFTSEIEVFANNAFVSNIGFDVDDIYLVDAPKLSQIPDQSIGHTTCVVPKVYLGRVGNQGDPWTLSAAVTGGDAGLVTAVSVVNTSSANLHEKGVRITPTTDQTKSGEATITLTATDIEGRRSTDSFTVWVNAGSFRNGSFEHNPFADATYPGCANIPRAWNNFFAPNARQEVIQQYEWKYGFRNYGLRVFQVPNNGSPFGGIVFQDVTGLLPNTEYVLSGWLGLDTWPDTNVTLPDGAGLRVEGDITAISPASGRVNQFSSGWSSRLTIRFRTGAAGTARVLLTGPNQPRYAAQFHDITLLAAG